MSEASPDAEISVFKASIRGDAARVRQLIRQGQDVTAPNPSGSTPLHFAATYGRMTVIRCRCDALNLSLVPQGAPDIWGLSSSERQPRKVCHSTSIQRSCGSIHPRRLSTRLSGTHIASLIEYAQERSGGAIAVSVTTAQVLKRVLSPNSLEFKVECSCGAEQWDVWRDEQQFLQLHRALNQAQQLPEARPESLRLSLKPSAGPPVRRLYPEGAHKPVPTLPASRVAWRDSEVNMRGLLDDSVVGGNGGSVWGAEPMAGSCVWRYGAGNELGDAGVLGGACSPRRGVERAARNGDVLRDTRSFLDSYFKKLFNSVSTIGFQYS